MALTTLHLSFPSTRIVGSIVPLAVTYIRLKLVLLVDLQLQRQQTVKQLVSLKLYG